MSSTPSSPIGPLPARPPTTPRGGSNKPPNSAVELERKRRLVRNVSILSQLVKDQLCGEDELVQALRIAMFADGEYIFCQGQPERDLYFVEDGKVLITQRRTAAASAAPSLASVAGALAHVGAVPRMSSGGSGRKRSVLEAEMETQTQTHQELDYFGELELLQNTARKANAVASGAVTCMILSEGDYATLLAPLHQLLLYRRLLRTHCVLEKDRLFKEYTPAQRQFLIDRCVLRTFADGESICRQGDLDDEYFILAEGEANVVLDELVPRSRVGSAVVNAAPADDAAGVASTAATASLAFGARTRSTVVSQRSLFQGFGEMGLLEKTRTAHVIAVGAVLCVVVSRKLYIGAAQLHGATIDVDAEALLATSLIEEWNLVINARNLHLSNPQVAHYLVMFIRKFKAAYNQKFAGRTLYLDLLRRLHQEPQLGDEFAFVSARVTWDSPSSSLGIIRSETRRVLAKPPSLRSAAETAFVGRLIEHTAFLNKFDKPPTVDRAKLARHLGRVVEFLNIAKDVPLFRQGKIESRAFVILRGKINIVNEDVGLGGGVGGSGSGVKHYEVIATLSAGDSFGELSLVTRLQRSATTLAACDTDLLVFDREHLLLVQAALPGVSVQQLMVQRADFLARLSFFKGSDFGQCIRVAHDLQEVAYEPRHRFLQESAHQRTLYIVKSGEVAVLVKTPLAQGGGPGKTALVRVATIGAQEFFGVAIASVNITAPPAAGVGSGATATSAAEAASATTWDLSSAVYMCTTHVVVLELSERGWRRLSPASLLVIRNVLLERHQWNEARAKRQREPGCLYRADRPWQPLPAEMYASDKASNGGASNQSCTNNSSADVRGRLHSHLARHIHDKKTRTSEYAKLFPSATPPTPFLAKNATPSSTGTGTSVPSDAWATRPATSPCTHPLAPPSSPPVRARATIPQSRSPRRTLLCAATASAATESVALALHSPPLRMLLPSAVHDHHVLFAIASRSPERAAARQRRHEEQRAQERAARDAERTREQGTAMWSASASACASAGTWPTSIE